MNRYMIDTNVFTHIVNRLKSWKVATKNLILHKADCCMSIISYFELKCQIAGAKLGKAKADELESLIGQLKIEPFNRRIAEEGVKIQAQLLKNGKGIGQRDAMIAGHAKHLGCIVVTNNLDEFGRAPGLMVEDWIDPF